MASSSRSSDRQPPDACRVAMDRRCDARRRPDRLEQEFRPRSGLTVASAVAAYRARGGRPMNTPGRLHSPSQRNDDGTDALGAPAPHQRDRSSCGPRRRDPRTVDGLTGDRSVRPPRGPLCTRRPRVPAARRVESLKNPCHAGMFERRDGRWHSGRVLERQFTSHRDVDSRLGAKVHQFGANRLDVGRVRWRQATGWGEDRKTAFQPQSAQRPAIRPRNAPQIGSGPGAALAGVVANPRYSGGRGSDGLAGQKSLDQLEASSSICPRITDRRLHRTR